MLRRHHLLSIIYLVVGVIIASDHDYITHLTTLKEIGSAVLAVVLWPLILLGIGLHIR
jgi:hypothetical protein